MRPWRRGVQVLGKKALGAGPWAMAPRHPPAGVLSTPCGQALARGLYSRVDYSHRVHRERRRSRASKLLGPLCPPRLRKARLIGLQKTHVATANLRKFAAQSADSRRICQSRVKSLCGRQPPFLARYYTIPGFLPSLSTLHSPTPNHG